MSDEIEPARAERIVVALDASPQSAAALRAAVQLAALLDAEVEGLFVEDVDTALPVRAPVLSRDRLAHRADQSDRRRGDGAPAARSGHDHPRDDAAGHGPDARALELPRATRRGGRRTAGGGGRRGGDEHGPHRPRAPQGDGFNGAVPGRPGESAAADLERGRGTRVPADRPLHGHARRRTRARAGAAAGAPGRQSGCASRCGTAATRRGMSTCWSRPLTVCSSQVRRRAKPCRR